MSIFNKLIFLKNENKIIKTFQNTIFNNIYEGWNIKIVILDVIFQPSTNCIQINFCIKYKNIKNNYTGSGDLYIMSKTPMFINNSFQFKNIKENIICYIKQCIIDYNKKDDCFK